MQVFSRLEGIGYGYLVVLVLIFFAGMAIVTLYSPFVPEMILGLRAPDSYVPSSLGFSSTIMLLYNAISWPGIKHAMVARKIEE